MSQIARMVIDDPSKMDILTTQMKKQIVEAATKTVNIQAAITRKNAIVNVASDFTLRNNFTQRNIQYNPCPLGSAHSLRTIQSSVGVTERAAYMERQEKGGEHRAESGGNLIIPTDKARGGNKKNPVPRLMYYRRITKDHVKGPFGKGAGSATVKSRYVAAAYIAWIQKKPRRINDKLFFVTNFIKGDGFIAFDQVMVYNMLHEATYTPARPWLEPASKQPASDGQAIFNKQMDRAGKL